MKSITAFAAVGGLLLLTACGTSEPASDSATSSVVPDSVDLTDGAFIPNGGSANDGDAPEGTDATDATDVTDAAGSTAPATTVAGGGAGTPDATTIPPTAGGSTAPTSSPTVTTVAGSTESLNVNEGIVRIGEVSYPFEADECDIDSTGFFILGYGTGSDGLRVEVDISGDTDDLDADGTDDFSFDLFVVPDADAGEDTSGLPDFFTTKITTSTFSEGDDVTVVIDGQRMSGFGPIEDFNEVVIPAGRTLPMTFELRCG